MCKVYLTLLHMSTSNSVITSLILKVAYVLLTGHHIVNMCLDILEVEFFKNSMDWILNYVV
jgi:hypothetical protein